VSDDPGDAVSAEALEAEALAEGAACIAERLGGAQRVLFITGAGLSVDSGLPTYRGVGGLYQRASTEDGLAIEDALSGRTFARDPSLCWKYIMQVEAAARGAEPNEGHRMIAELEARFEVWVLTQNVDGLHRRAGSTQVIDIHGDVHRLLCTGCAWSLEIADYATLTCPPHCDSCGSVLRPDVVLFGEMLPLAKLGRLETQLRQGFDAVLSVGTSSLFPYIAQPLVLARQRGALTVEINPGDTVVSNVAEIRMRGGSSEALSAIRTALSRQA
jgi:NAD-dependent protein deacetylase/lipoamidase